MASWLLLVLAGGLGAVARFLLDGVLRPVQGRFPWGIVVVNLLGSLLLGLVLGWGRAGLLPDPWPAVLGVGFCGGFTTFSTAAVDFIRLVGERHPVVAMAHWGGMALGCLLAAALGLALAA